ncbi:MAG: O-antigen ligase family protein [Gaiellaceae bacterium]
MTSVPAPTTWTGAAVARAERQSRVPDLLVLLFVFVFYTNLAVVLTRFHGVPQIVASGVAVLLFVPIVKYLVIERRPVVVTPVLPLFLLFLAALFLSGTLSQEPDVVREAIDIYLTEGLLLYLLVSNAVRTTRMLTMVVWTLIAAASMLGALSIVQELTHTYENNYAGFAQVDRLDVGGNFNIAPDSAEDKELRPRLGGPLGSENRYAQILAVIFPFALIRAFRDPRRRFRLLGAGASVLIAGGVILSFSRGAAVALAATIVLMVLFRELKFRHVALALAGLTAVVLLAFPHYLIRIGSLEKITSLSAAETTSDGPDSAIVGRQTENLAAWNTFLDHPLTGVGPGAYFHEYSREYANRLGIRYLESDRRGHSLYLEMAADLGMIGLGAFAAMVGAALLLLHRAMRYWRRLDPERAIVASSLFFGLVAYLATAAFLHLSYQRYFWILLALASSAIWTLRQEQRRDTESPSIR